MNLKAYFAGAQPAFFWANALGGVAFNVGVVGVSWFIIRATGQNTVLGTYGAISLVSSFITLLFIGNLIDRVPKVQLMKWSCLLQLAVFLLTGILYGAGVPVLGIIYALALVNMPVALLFVTASRGIIPSLMSKDELVKGNCILEMSVQIGALAAAALTGFLYDWVGFSALLYGACALLGCAACVLQYNKRVLTDKPGGGEDFAGELKEALVYFRKRPQLWFYGLVAFVPGVVISASNVVIPGYVEKQLLQSALVYGLGDMLFAGGALCAGVALGTRLRTKLKEGWLVGFFALSVLSLLGFAWIGSASGFFVNIFICGFLLASLRVMLNALFMAKVDTTYIGRCLVLLTAASMLFQAVFSYLLGLSMDAWGVAVGYVLLAGLAALGLAGLPFLISKKTS